MRIHWLHSSVIKSDNSYKMDSGRVIPKFDECIHHQYGGNQKNFIEFLLLHLTDNSFHCSISYWIKHLLPILHSDTTDKHATKNENDIRWYDTHNSICNDCKLEILIQTQNLSLLKQAFDKFESEWCGLLSNAEFQLRVLLWMLISTLNYSQIAKLCTRSPISRIQSHRNMKNDTNYTWKNYTHRRFVNLWIKVWKYEIKRLEMIDEISTNIENAYYYRYNSLCKLTLNVYCYFTLQDWKIMINSNVLIDILDIVTSCNLNSDQNKDKICHNLARYNDFVIGMKKDVLLHVFMQFVAIVINFLKNILFYC